MSTTSKPEVQPIKRGFDRLPCPLCGEETIIRIDLDDLDHCTCGECEGEFTTDDVRNLIEKWSKVLDWISTAPAK